MYIIPQNYTSDNNFLPSYILYSSVFYYSTVILNKNIFFFVCCRVGESVAQLVEALRYKPESRGLDFQWCHWNFSST